MNETKTVPEIERSLHTRYARPLRDRFLRAVRDFSLLSPGDRVAVCLSGGKDSFVLAKLMEDYVRYTERDIGLVFLAMDPGYTPAHRAALEENAARLGLKPEIFETDVLRIAGKHAADHPCFLCAKMRRGHLYAQAQARGCNKIALGHHYDDAIETVLLGLVYGGQVQAMLPRLRSRNYPGIELIRPLYYVRERDVAAWAEENGLCFSSCSCPAQHERVDSKRLEIKELIASLAARNPQIEANLFHAVQNVDTAKVLGWRDSAGKHSFLDTFSE